MLGIVVKSTGATHTVLANNKKKYECSLRGKFRINGLNATNPIAVGDRVEFEFNEKKQNGVINKICERKNYIIRKAISSANQVHVIASNVDLAILVATPVDPKTSSGFIDRFLLTAESHNVPVNIIFNKKDIYNSKHQEQIDAWAVLYKSIGYDCINISSFDNIQMKEVRQMIHGKVCLFAGNSGVGKSTILNNLLSELEIPTSPISQQTGKGIHTTSFAEMHKMDEDGTFLIDTPGLKELGIVNLEPYEISHFFVEMRKRIGCCKFNNCFHINEPKCSVIDAVKTGEINAGRYENYLRILESVRNKQLL